MATTVQNLIGGGVNIKDLTEMERFLIGMLGRKYMYKDETGARVRETILVPFSSNTVQTINVSLQCDYPYAQSNMPTLIIFGNTVQFPYNTYNSETHNLTPISSDIVANIFNITRSVNWVINSFTTTDGKVHTASNLNY